MRNVLEADYSRNILIISVYNMSRKRLILNISLRKRINWEKLKSIGLKRASNRALNP